MENSTPAPLNDPRKDHEPPDPVLNLLRDLIRERTGLFYEDSKDFLLLDKLSPLVAERGFRSLMDYYYLLKHSDPTENEWRRVETALVVNESFFWREWEQVRAVVEVLVPQLQKERPGQPVRIWHAACASGEEPYTMAIALEEAGRYQYGPIEIYATDINTAAIAAARAGEYRTRSFRSIPPEIVDKYFSVIYGVRGAKHRLCDHIRQKVQFSRLNLMDEVETERMRNFDIIFCRNVFIYFSPISIAKAASYLHRALKDEGYLFISAVESLLRITTLFDLVEIGEVFAYQK